TLAHAHASSDCQGWPAAAGGERRCGFSTLAGSPYARVGARPTRSTLRDRVFRKDRLAAFERFVDRGFGGHPFVNHIEDRQREHALATDLRSGRVVDLVGRDRRTVDALPGVGL